MSELTVRLFISSPYDVRSERDRVVTLVDRLNGEFEDVVKIDVLRWEDAFYTSAQSFQEQIDTAVANIAEVDIVVCILWSRIGLKLNPAIWKRNGNEGYESGTVYEYETAVALNKKNSGVPDVYLFRKLAPIVYRAENVTDDMGQHQLLEQVWARWTQSADGFNTAGFQTFADTDEFERQIEGWLRGWLERRGILVVGPVWDRRIKGSPFRGLAAFESSHTAVFFGRDAAISRITAKLRSAHFLLLIGASGTGKSSLLRAGLMPRIVKPGVVPHIDLWCPATVTPSTDTLLGLAQALAADGCLGPELAEANCSIRRLAQLLRQGGDPVLSLIEQTLASAAATRAGARGYDVPRPARVLLAVDQLERLFVEAPPDDVRTFAALLRNLVQRNLAFVIAALRSDSYGDYQVVEAFTALRESGATHDLLPPNSSELEEIVSRPVSACHPPLVFETTDGGKSLAEVLVEEARGGDALPLLQMTLEHLYQCEKARGDGLLRFSDYGSLDQAVIQVAGEAFATIDEAARASIPALITAFAHDLSLDPATGKPVVTLRPVARAAFERGLLERKALVDTFLAYRLLTTEESGGEIRVRPVHEALLRVWPEAVRILTESETIIRVRRTIEPLVTQWTDGGRSLDSDLLLASPALLAGAQQLIERLGEDVAEPMRDYIAASISAERRRSENERRRRDTIMTATGGMRASVIPYYRPLVLVLLLLAAVVGVLDPPGLERLRLWAFDAYQQITPRERTASPAVIVDLDEASLQAIGQWPWPRTVMADLVSRIHQLGAVGIGLDMIFPEPDRMSPGIAARTFRGLDDATLAKLDKLPSNDEVLADALKRAGVVIGDAGVPVPIPVAEDIEKPWLTGFAILGPDLSPFLVTFPGLRRNIPILETAAAGHGMLSINPDADGIVRHLPIIMSAQGRIMPALPFEMLRLAAGSSGIRVRTNEAGVVNVGLPGIKVPTDGNGQFWIYYGRRDSARYVSAKDVLDGSLPADRLRGRLVLIGTSAVGLLDFKTTPLEAVPGVEIHAQALENILTRKFLLRPNTARAQEVLVTVAALMMLSLLMARLSAPALALVSAAVIITIGVGGWATFRYMSVLVDPAYPAAAVVTFIVVITLLKYGYSEAQRTRIRRVFDPPPIR